MVDDVAGIDQVAVDLAGHGGLGKARADRLGDVHDGDGFVELAAAAVWERDVDHWQAGIGDWGLGIRDSGFGRARAGADTVVGSRPQKKRRSAEHTAELQSLMRISYAVFCLTKQNH